MSPVSSLVCSFLLCFDADNPFNFDLIYFGLVTRTTDMTVLFLNIFVFLLCCRNCGMISRLVRFRNCSWHSELIFYCVRKRCQRLASFRLPLQQKNKCFKCPNQWITEKVKRSNQWITVYSWTAEYRLLLTETRTL